MNSFFRNASIGLASIAALAVAPAAQAGSLFGNTGIMFEEDTTLKFTFEEAHGKYTSSLGVFSGGSLIKNLFVESKSSDAEAKPWASTCGGADSAVASCTATFDFAAGVMYTLGLSPSVGDSFSTDSLNDDSEQRAVFSTDPISFGDDEEALKDFADYKGDFFASLADGVFVGIDDGGNGGDQDFQDFVVSVSYADTTSVPEPASALALIAVGAASLKLRRRHDA